MREAYIKGLPNSNSGVLLSTTLSATRRSGLRMLSDQLAKLLRSSRKAAGLTQKEAARRTGVSHRLWAEVERGERPNVSLETALRMLGAVGISLQLTDPRGKQRRLGASATNPASRAARAAVRRSTWQGTQIDLRSEGTSSPVTPSRAARLGAVGVVSNQAFALARSIRRSPASSKSRSGSDRR
jgi:transcriptional regulator with XRE-family HTH domain